MEGNKVLQICALAAFMYCGNVFANIYDDESSSEIMEDQQSTKDQDIKKFGTKDQWQRFFEQQGEPQQLFFLTPEQAKSIIEKKRAQRDFLIRKLKSLKSQQDINDLTNKLNKLSFEDSIQREDNTAKTGKLIDIDDESAEDLSNSPKKIKTSNTYDQTIKSPVLSRKNAEKQKEAELSENVRQSQQHYRVRLNKAAKL